MECLSVHRQLELAELFVGLESEIVGLMPGGGVKFPPNRQRHGWVSCMSELAAHTRARHSC